MVEKDLVEGECMIWLDDELYKCDAATQYLATVSDKDLGKKMQNVTVLKSYCEDCSRVWGNVKERFTTLR